MKSESNILVMMSGSIACAKATSLISAWVRQGHSVRVACTSSVETFVGRATLEGLSGQSVFDDTFEKGRAMDHISLAQWADLIVVCPATANLLNRFSSGIADDAVTTLWQAAWGRGAPGFIVPAMNTHMWNYPATQESVARLKSWGIHILPTAQGELACGEVGAGRMLEPGQIMEMISALLEQDLAKSRGRVLITGGGTREPIDAVRYIGNHSSGQTSATLADELTDQGYEVTWLGAESAIRPSYAARYETFISFKDLDNQLRSLLGEQSFEVVMHAAAVSDFSVAEVSGAGSSSKLSSEQEVNIQLRPNPKLLGRIRQYSSNPGVKVIGFKLTVGADEVQKSRSISKQFEQAGTDFVVHNDFCDISTSHHSYQVHAPDGGQTEFNDARDLARGIGDLLEV